jgi:hypothetical protein
VDGIWGAADEVPVVLNNVHKKKISKKSPFEKPLHICG